MTERNSRIINHPWRPQKGASICSNLTFGRFLSTFPSYLELTTRSAFGRVRSFAARGKCAISDSPYRDNERSERLAKAHVVIGKKINKGRFKPVSERKAFRLVALSGRFAIKMDE